MADQGCTCSTNASTTNAEHQSSAVPMIGLYISFTSLLCLLIMVYDTIFYGFVARKHWLPCILFKVDSMSMTLLSFTTMIAVDLTTLMPSRWDQLSKLTGTALVCICMGYVVPSIGANSNFECFANMVGFAIFVTFITTDITMQLNTGVIATLVMEHIIILILMLVLLLIFCCISVTIKSDKKIDSAGYTAILTRGPDTMFERLKLCFLHAHCTDPQFKISRYPINVAVGTICLVCAVIVVEAAFRILILNPLELDQGSSDYSWSTQFIVITQIAAIISGGTIIVIRSAAMFSRMDFQSMFLHSWPANGYEKQLHQAVRAKGKSVQENINSLLGSILTGVGFLVQFLIVCPLWLASHVWLRQDDNCLEYFGVDRIAATKHTLQQGIDDMIRLNDQVARSMPPYHSSRFLCRRPPSEYCNLSSMTIWCGTHIEIEVGTLSMVLLVKIAEASIPIYLLAPLLEAFHGAEEVIHYIDEAIPPDSSSKIHKLKQARALWARGDLSCLLPDHIQRGQDHTVAAAVATIENLKNVLCDGDAWDDAGHLINIILGRNYESIEELQARIEELFADMLHILFAQLPNAIFSALSKTPPENLESSTKSAMELLLKVGSFDCQRDWQFPSGMLSMVPAPESKFQGQFGRLEKIVLVRVSLESASETTNESQGLV